MRSRLRAVSGILLLAAAALAGCRSIRPDGPGCRSCDHYLGGAAQPCPLELALLPPAAAEIDNLVFQGGGVKGTAYAGSLVVLDGQDLLAPVGRVAGTSAGALTALVVSLGYSPQEVVDLMMKIDYRRFEDGRFPADAVRLIEDYGWFAGDFALCLLRCLVAEKTGDPKTTFRQLHALHLENPRFRDLFVVGTDVVTKESVLFWHGDERLADVPIADAARISMSIPFFFASRRLPQLDDDVFVDGGVLRNYPIEVFDDEPPRLEPGRPRGAPEVADAPNPATLGFHLGGEPPPAAVGNLLEFIKELFTTLLDEQIDATCRTPRDIERSVFIDTLGIATTDFGIDPKQKCALIRQGALAAERYFSEGPWKECPAKLQE